MTYPAQHYHDNNTDTLDAIVSAPGPWTATGKVTGNPVGGLSLKYDFSGLADGVSYTVRVRAGALPAATDIVVATIEPDVVSGGGGGGVELTGPYLVTITVVDDASGDPIQSANVRIYQGLYTQTKPTNANGVATFTVELATWSLLANEPLHVGESDSIIVPSELTKEIRLTAIPVLTSDDPNLCAGILRIINQYGGPVQNESIQVKIIGSEFASSSYISNINRTHTTDVNGEVILTLVNASSFTDGEGVYEITVGNGRGKCSFRMNAPTSDNFEITQIL